MGKRCKLGKSCGAACINRLDRCVLELGEILKNSLFKFRELVSKLAGKSGSKAQPPQSPQPTSIPEGSYKVRGEAKGEISRESKNELNGAFRGGREREFIKESVRYGKSTLIDKTDKEIKEIAKGQLNQNKEFMKRLGSNLPENIRVIVGGNILQMSVKTDSGDRVAVYYSPKIGFHFNVNGTVDVGTVKTREGQVQVASTVRSIYDATVRSLPEGSVIRTRAHTADGLGERRVAIYNKLGFSKPDELGDMFGVVGSDNTVSPSSKKAFREQRKSASSVFFSEPQSIQ